MKRIIVVLVVILLIGGAVGGGWWYVSQHPEVQEQLLAMWDQLLTELELKGEEPIAEGLQASGTIEAHQVFVTSEVSGRIVALHADEGDAVEENQVLVELDTTLVEAELEAALAGVTVAEAQLAQVKAGARDVDIRQAEAVLAQAEVARDVAYQAWQDAQLLRDNPQDLQVQIAAAETEVAVAEHRLKQALALKDAAEKLKDHMAEVLEKAEEGVEVIVPLPGGGTEKRRVYPDSQTMAKLRDEYGKALNNWWQAWIGVNSAQAALDGAKDSLAVLQAQLANPHTLQAQVDAAYAQYEAAQAAVAQAQAALDALRAGASEEQIAVAEAAVDQAWAAVEPLRVRFAKMTIRAPISGVVLERPVHEGEVVMTGGTLYTLADLDEVTLTIYVPETDLGRVRLGQEVLVTVDTFPGRIFKGEITYIASEAEFTPKNIQTKEERVNMVFAVKVRIPNPDHALKPGMPADAVIPEGD